MSLISVLGTLGLAVGVFGGIVRRGRALILFLCPFLLSETFVAIAGANLGRLRGNPSPLPLCLFMLGQFGLLTYIIYKTRNTLSSSIAFSIFSLSYALIAALVGGMALADDWL